MAVYKRISWTPLLTASLSAGLQFQLFIDDAPQVVSPAEFRLKSITLPTLSLNSAPMRQLGLVESSACLKP